MIRWFVVAIEVVCMAINIDEDSIEGAWTHSHEEDEGDRLVFRYSEFAFPPSRGRTEITLKSGGVVEVGYPGPDDRRKRSPGRWTLEGNLLEIEAPGWSGTFEIESLSRQALVVRRKQKED